MTTEHQKPLYKLSVKGEGYGAAFQALLIIIYAYTALTTVVWLIAKAFGV